MFAFYENKPTLLQAGEGCEMDFPLHLHVCPEFIYLEKGRLSVRIGDGEYPLNGGDFALIFPNRVHAYHTLSSPRDTCFRLVICQHEMAGCFADTLLSGHPSRPVVGAGRLHADVPYAMERLVAAGREEADPAVVKALVQLILARTLPLTELIRNRDVRHSSLAVRAVVYLSEHFLEPVTLDSLAKELGVCRYSLSRAFSGGVGIGFCQYVSRMRVGYAKSLLENTGGSILTVGLESGFENQRTFNRVFKSLCGVTPLQYRKRRMRL